MDRRVPMAVDVVVAHDIAKPDAATRIDEGAKG